MAGPLGDRRDAFEVAQALGGDSHPYNCECEQEGGEQGRRFRVSRKGEELPCKKCGGRARRWWATNNGPELEMIHCLECHHSEYLGYVK